MRTQEREGSEAEIANSKRSEKATMPPSGPLLGLYPAEPRTPPPCVPGSAASPLRLQHTEPTKLQASDSENTHQPGNSLGDVGSSTQQASLIFTQSAPFLEMEDENETDRAFKNSMPVPNQSLNETEIANHNLLLPVAPPNAHEDGKEDGSLCLAARCSNTAPSPNRARSVSCGKRPRNSRKVSFAPESRWASKIPTTAFVPQQSQRCGNNLLHTIRETIHFTDYTDEERMATWYTLADLRSFKKERKDTARQVDSGLLSLRTSADQTNVSDIFVDTTSFDVPVEYCSRGAENCTEVMSRIRYRHICDGWRYVLNTQEKHNYLRRKLSTLTSSEQEEYNALAALLGAGNHKASRKSTTNNSWHSYGTSPRSSPKSSQNKNPFANMCCPYDLAAVYLPISEASLQIARSRGIADEIDAIRLRNEDRLQQERQQPTDVHSNNQSNPAQDEKEDSSYNIAGGLASFAEAKMRSMDL